MLMTMHGPWVMDGGRPPPPPGRDLMCLSLLLVFFPTYFSINIYSCLMNACMLSVDERNVFEGRQSLSSRVKRTKCCRFI